MAPGNDSGPLFMQIAEQLMNQIADGGLAAGDRIPSTNELASFHQVNPATAARALTLLADDGLAEKRRGVGMFVAPGARDRLVQTRRKQFAALYVRPMVVEGTRLGLAPESIQGLVRDELASVALATGAPS